MKKIIKKKKWYRLDNAAKIYPSVASRRTTAMFRLSATLVEKIQRDKLQSALNKTIKLYPAFKVKLKGGLFWHYLEENFKTPLVKEETTPPCRKISKKDNNGFLFRVLYFNKKISVEFSHIITDGTGALNFLISLISNYTGTDISNISEKNFTEELEDAYLKYYKKNIPFPDKKTKAFQIKSPLLESEECRVITGIVDVNLLKKQTSLFQVSITEFLTSLYIFSIQEYLFSLSEKKLKKFISPIRVLVPVNLRKLYPSKTVRNFFLAVMPAIDPRLGKYTFKEIIKIVYHYMRVEVDEKFINQQIARNVGSEKNFFVRLIPLFLKIPFEKIIYKRMSSALHSGLLTNVGIAPVNENLSKFIERFDFIPNPNEYIKINCGIISFNNKINISFTNLTENNEIQRIFFSKLREMDIMVKIETNYSGD